MNNLQKLDPENYKRLFRLKGLGLLVNDIYIRVYRKYDFLIIINEGDYISFINKKDFKKTIKSGHDFYKEEKNFYNFKKETGSFIENLENYLDKISSQSDYSKGDLQKLFNYCIKLLVYYKYMDYNYADAYFQIIKEVSPKIRRIKINEFGETKNKLRKYLTDLFVSENSKFNIILGKIGKKHRIKPGILKEYKISEVIGIRDGSKVTDKIIDERLEATAMHTKDKKIEYIWGEPALNVFHRFVGKSKKRQRMIKGITASAGIAAGRAKVISAEYDDMGKTKEKIKQMEKGEILVSETTSPDIMEACYKASAIITNQGGMLSHAAIVSRELGIPCIVSTNNATEILNDGDMVEVDAERGIVRILK